MVRIWADRQELEFLFRTLTTFTELDILWDGVMVCVVAISKNVRRHLLLHFHHLRQGDGTYTMGPPP